MIGFQIVIEGKWGHFKKPETNNNPLSHDIITKTALIGLIGAVIGIDRVTMRALFPQLSEDLLYGVQLLSPVRKLSWGFTSKTAINPTGSGAPKYFEFLKNPKYLVVLALNNERSQKIFHDFFGYVKEGKAVYTPVLGIHNCPASITWVSEGKISDRKHGEFSTKGFVLASKHSLKNVSDGFRIGFDKIPTFQTQDFWNLPDKYESIIYPDYPHTIDVDGDFYEFKVSKSNSLLSTINVETLDYWCLI
jgi:CRISPR-associated protein Cas5h